MTRSPLAWTLLLGALALPPLLTACAPVIVAGAAGAALVATDRRSAGEWHGCPQDTSGIGQKPPPRSTNPVAMSWPCSYSE